MGRRQYDALNVAMVTRRPPSEHGGVERVVASLQKELARVRPSWRLEVVSAFRKTSRLEGMDGLNDIIASLCLGWRLRRSTADVVFVYCPECLWGIRLLRKRRSPPPLIAVWCGVGPTPSLVLGKPGHPLARALAWLRTIEERRALPADGHIAVHAVVAKELRRLYGLRKPVTIIEPALDAEILEQMAQPIPSRTREGLTAVWIGQASYRKGLQVALSAVAEARRDLPQLRLTVAGVPPGKPQDWIEWLGIVSPTSVAEVYRNADLFIFPTRYESFGLVVIEAMAAGLPVIVSDAVPPGIVADGRNGIVVPGHDPLHYAAALRRLADPRVREAIAIVSREDARRFRPETTAVGYAAVAESVAGVGQISNIRCDPRPWSSHTKTHIS